MVRGVIGSIVSDISRGLRRNVLVCGWFGLGRSFVLRSILDGVRGGSVISVYVDCYRGVYLPSDLRNVFVRVVYSLRGVSGFGRVVECFASDDLGYALGVFDNFLGDCGFRVVLGFDEVEFLRRVCRYSEISSLRDIFRVLLGLRNIYVICSCLSTSFLESFLGDIVKLFNVVKLRFLSRFEALRFIRNVSSRFGVIFSDEEAFRIFELTQGNPRYIEFFVRDLISPPSRISAGNFGDLFREFLVHGLLGFYVSSIHSRILELVGSINVCSRVVFEVARGIGSIKEVAERIGRFPQHVSLVIRKLKDLGVVREISGRLVLSDNVYAEWLRLYFSRSMNIL